MYKSSLNPYFGIATSVWQSSQLQAGIDNKTEGKNYCFPFPLRLQLTLIHHLLTKPTFFAFAVKMRYFIHVCKKLKGEFIMLSLEQYAVGMVTY